MPGQSKTNLSCVTTGTTVEAQDTHPSYFLPRFRFNLPCLQYAQAPHNRDGPTHPKGSKLTVCTQPSPSVTPHAWEAPVAQVWLWLLPAHHFWDAALWSLLQTFSPTSTLQFPSPWFLFF